MATAIHKECRGQAGGPQILLQLACNFLQQIHVAQQRAPSIASLENLADYLRLEPNTFLDST